MKTLLFSLLAFITLAVVAPVAQAGQYARVYTNHGPVYLHKSQLYGGNYNSGNCNNRYSRHRSHHRSHYSRPAYYSRPVYYSRPSYSHYRPHCNTRSGSRVSFSFGF